MRSLNKVLVSISVVLFVSNGAAEEPLKRDALNRKPDADQGSITEFFKDFRAGVSKALSPVSFPEIVSKEQIIYRDHNISRESESILQSTYYALAEAPGSIEAYNNVCTYHITNPLVKMENVALEIPVIRSNEEPRHIYLDLLVMGNYEILLKEKTKKDREILVNDLDALSGLSKCLLSEGEPTESIVADAELAWDVKINISGSRPNVKGQTFRDFVSAQAGGHSLSCSSLRKTITKLKEKGGRTPPVISRLTEGAQEKLSEVVDKLLIFEGVEAIKFLKGSLLKTKGLIDDPDMSEQEKVYRFKDLGPDLLSDLFSTSIGQAIYINHTYQCLKYRNPVPCKSSLEHFLVHSEGALGSALEELLSGETFENGSVSDIWQSVQQYSCVMYGFERLGNIELETQRENSDRPTKLGYEL